jgi:aspartate-semialdehyde dehydrogenase
MRRVYSAPPQERKKPVIVLGATGLVGQRVIALLEGHPWLSLSAVAASDSRIGDRYGANLRWKVETPPPAEALDQRLTPAMPSADVRGAVVISALPTDEARVMEPEWARAGAIVLSNASAYRMAEDVPLIVPEINPDHLAIIEKQRAKRDWPGALITNPNCSTIGLTLALAPLLPFGLRRVVVTTFQAVSGAGYPGVASLDIIDNVIPYIGGEEEKLVTETRKILGVVTKDAFAPIDSDEMRIGATCVRVPVRDGHFESVSVELATDPTPVEIIQAWRDFSGEPQHAGLPSAPDPLLIYREERDRPQPITDRLAGDGMAVTIGRLRAGGALTHSFTLLSHNTIRGAAGAALLNAELAIARGLLD